MTSDPTTERLTADDLRGMLDTEIAEHIAELRLAYERRIEALALDLKAAEASTKNLNPDRQLREIVRDLHWMARRYADGRMSYATSTFNAHTRALLALGVDLNPTSDGTVWARDGMGRCYDGLTDEEAAQGHRPDALHDPTVKQLRESLEAAEARCAVLGAAVEQCLDWIDMPIVQYSTKWGVDWQYGDDPTPHWTHLREAWRELRGAGDKTP